MPSIARVKTDSAAGIIQGPGTRTVFADGKKISLIGDKVATHGNSPHASPTLVSNGAKTVKTDGGIPAMVGTIATCGHAVINGSQTVFVS